MDVEMVDCVNNEQLPQNNTEQSENYGSPSTNEEIGQQEEEPEEKVNLIEVDIERRNSSANIFVEIPVETRSRSNESSPDSDDSVIFSNDGEGSCCSLNSNIRPRKSCEPPKDLLSEVSEIIVSLSDDERFQQYINYSNGNGFVFSNGTEKRRTSVDAIFTYNVLNILFTKLKELKGFYELVHRENDRLAKENRRSEAEHLAYQVQVESLEKAITEQKEAIEQLNQKVAQKDEFWELEKKELLDKYETELSVASRKYEVTRNEKDTAVMKYVKNESELISIKKEKDMLSKRLKSIEHERDDLSKKYKAVMADKSSIAQVLDTKKNELIGALKNIEKYKEESNYKDIKFKWIEDNLQKEIIQHKDKNNQLNTKINELEEELSKYRSSVLYSSKDSDYEKDSGSGNEESLHVESDPEVGIDISIANVSPKKDGTLIEENNALLMKIQRFEVERLDYEKNLVNMKQVTESQSQKITSLQNQLLEIETLRSALTQMDEKILAYQREIDRLKETNEDLQQDMESCREKEAELLNFTEKLTAKNVSLQSEYTVMEAKKVALEEDRIPISNRISELEEKITELNGQLKREIESRDNENKKLTELLSEKNQEFETIKGKLEEQQAENQSLKHKYSSTIRELNKEVQQYRKLRQFDGTECNNSGDSTGGLESRTSSCSSLNDQQLCKIEPDRQTLIERIVKLQRINAKHVEKVEFLEEHVAQLLAEVKKKSKVLQYYIIREQSGALSSEVMDQNKAEMTKYGGIMASIYNSKCDDGSIPLELSLEINRKLQAVLEDTLLKNITLKENIETLGKEIDRLTAANKSKS